MNLILKRSWISSFHWGQSPNARIKTKIETKLETKLEARTRGKSKSQSNSRLKKVGFVYLLGPEDHGRYERILSEHGLRWQQEDLRNQNRELSYFQGTTGPVWIAQIRTYPTSAKGTFQKESSYTLARELFGSLVGHFKAHHLEQLHWEVCSADEASLRGALVGLELGAYNFRSESGTAESNNLFSDLEVFVKLTNSNWQSAQIKACEAEAFAINSARHWVNLPPNHINPEGVAQIVKTFPWSAQMTTAIWNNKTLEKEKMNLLLAVGQGSATEPCLIHLKYRPQKKNKLKPIAFVGKGVTFDTGGLDIKSSAGMRLMKKDMGGAAAVLGLATWVSKTNYPRACDFYLCLAENSIDARSFRPSDLIQSRAGHWIEIDNTDAEGRLVLADGLDVAVKQKESPEYVIDVATLTGAIKVALGAEVAGLFANDDQLAADLHKAGLDAGDYNWRMPLVDRYFSGLGSAFADFKNSSEGFGGAITAALFLQKFVGKSKWAHLDIYAWSDKAQGGSGQSVQALIEFLKMREKN